VNPIGDGQELIDWLAGRMQDADKAKSKSNGYATLRPDGGSPRRDEAIIEMCRAAENAAKFEALFDHGDVNTYHDGDDSAADLALVSMLTFYTQDPDQLEGIFSASALGQREKWRRRSDYRERTIRKALADGGETHQWGREREYNHHGTGGGHTDDDYIRDEPRIVWFHELGKPKPRRFVIEKIARKGYPLVVYGAGGVAKSFAALAGGIAIASEGGLRNWMGLRVLEHGYVLYLDFELDQDEQHARVAELCSGLGVDIPKRLAYLSGRGMDRADAFAQAHDFTKDYKAVAVVVDSVGQAITGDMDKNYAVNAFFRDHIEPFSLWGTTPILVDHEGKRQSGEKHKDKTIIGGVYKANNARGVLQFILEEYDKDEHRLDIRVRVPKINFEPPEPFGISITFEPEKVSIETRILPDEELLDEEREPLRKRVYAALITEPLSVIDLSQTTGAAVGSVRNTLSQLMGEDLVAATTARPKLYYRLDGPGPDDEYNHHRPTPGVSGDDDTRERPDEPRLGDPTTVAEFFAHAPDWLTSQLKVYRRDPIRHFKPLCSAVAAEVLGDGARGDEVAAEVRRLVQ
jgi:hypothetical protein